MKKRVKKNSTTSKRRIRTKGTADALSHKGLWPDSNYVDFPEIITSLSSYFRMK